jgi:ArsR family transcriptional regulator
MKSEADLNRFRAKVFNAIADPVRLKILEFLREKERCACEFVPLLKIVQPLVSRHLKILKDCGLVRVWKDGNRRIYSITDPRIFNVIDNMTQDLQASLSKLIIEHAI